jgi:hypothetical protein
VSGSTKHAYEVVEIHGQNTGNVQVGGHLIGKNHVRKHHEPYRTWQFLDLDKEVNSGDGFTTFVGKHIGEYEKVKHLLSKEDAS